MAAKAGAAYVSPFVGRLDDISTSGMDLVSDIVTIFDNYGYQTEIIVASVRSPMHVVEAALAGADIATIPLRGHRPVDQAPADRYRHGEISGRLEKEEKIVSTASIPEGSRTEKMQDGNEADYASVS